MTNIAQIRTSPLYRSVEEGTRDLMGYDKKKGIKAKAFGWSKTPDRALEHPVRAKVGVRLEDGEPRLVLMFRETDGVPGKRPRQLHVELPPDEAVHLSVWALQESQRLKKLVDGPSETDKLCAPMEDLLEKQFERNGYVGVEVPDRE